LTEDFLCSSSLFTNSNWFAFDEDKALNDASVISEASPSPNSEISSPKLDDENDEVILGDVIDDTKGSEPPSAVSNKDIDEEVGHTVLANGIIDKLEDDIRPPTPDVDESQPQCVGGRKKLNLVLLLRRIPHFLILRLKMRSRWIPWMMSCFVRPN
jgi:serine/threonine-protein phosphatase 6 regulatory subunit 3